VDAHVAAHQIPEGVSSADLSDELIRSADLVVVLTEHDGIDYGNVAAVAKQVFDTRNCLSGPNVEVL
jgi:UDP-N-acetyl-D-glucosamine dehydrogenase